MFENPEIVLDDLPSAADLDWQALHPPFVRRMQLQRAIIVLIVVAANVAISLIPGTPLRLTILLWAAVASFSVAFLIWPVYTVPRRGYVVRDKDIVYRSGVFWRSVTAVPYNRIQHVETSNTPLDRKFSVATLQLFTAGGSGGDLRIDGLYAKTAESLRLHILEKTGSSVEHA